MDILSSALISRRMQNMQSERNDCQFQIVSVAICLIASGAHMNISFTNKVWAFSSSSNGRPPIMLIIEPRMVNKFGVCSPISFKHMFFWYPFLHSHSTTHHSNMAAQLKKVTMKGLHTLQRQTLYFPLVFTVSSKAHSLEHSIVLTKYITNSNIPLSFLTPLFLAFFLVQGFVLSPMGSLRWNWGLGTHAIQQFALVFPLPLEM